MSTARALMATSAASSVALAGWPPDAAKNKARSTAGTAPGPSFIANEGVEDFASRSTSTQAQHQRILAALPRRPQSTFELRALGVMQVSARIFELRAMGLKVVTAHRVSAQERDGLEHYRVGVYALVKALEARP